MRIEGTIRPTGDRIGFSREAWCRLVSRRSEFRRYPPVQCPNPFKGGKIVTIPSKQDAAEVLLDGRPAGKAYWSMSEEPLVCVIVEEPAIPMVIDRNEYYDGAPTVVVEIRSPGDETWDKLEFFARIGVPEVWVVNRDTRVPQVFRVATSGYEELQADSDRWLRSPITEVQLRPGPAGYAGSPIGRQRDHAA